MNNIYLMSCRNVETWVECLFQLAIIRMAVDCRGSTMSWPNSCGFSVRSQDMVGAHLLIWAMMVGSFFWTGLHSWLQRKCLVNETRKTKCYQIGFTVVDQVGCMLAESLVLWCQSLWGCYWLWRGLVA